MELVKSHGSRNEIFVAAARPESLPSGAASFARRVCDPSGPAGGGDGVYFHDGGEAWFYNPDGTTAELCGNGMRCLGRHLLDQHGGEEVTVISGGTPYTIARAPEVRAVRQVAVGLPPLAFTGVPESFAEYTAVVAPNPHVVTVVDKYHEPDLISRGELAVSVFPEGANVSFLLPLADDEIFVRTYERGAGLTPSCGSGAVAARAVWSRVSGIDPARPVLVRNAGGVARSWIDVKDGRWHPVLEGNATVIFRAESDLDGTLLTPCAYAISEATAYATLEAENTYRLRSLGIIP
jgi:diaminopimelate epimerase